MIAVKEEECKPQYKIITGSVRPESPLSGISYTIIFSFHSSFHCVWNYLKSPGFWYYEVLQSITKYYEELRRITKYYEVL